MAPWRGVVAACAACSFTLVAPAGSQEVVPGGSLLQLLDPATRSLALNVPASGALTVDDLVSLSGTRVQAWALDAPAGDRVTVDLESDDFDAVLFVVGPGIVEPLQDDDGGGACNARLEFPVPDSGPYRLVVGAFGEQTGRFRLTASDRPSAPALGDCVGPDEALPLLTSRGRILRVPSEQQGELGGTDYQADDGRYLQAWTVPGAEGDTAVIDLVSTDFDAQLYLRGPGIVTHIHDDDGASNCNARISLRFPRTGDYELVVTSLESDVTGSFSLFAGHSDGPERPGACGAGSDRDQVELLRSLSSGGRTLDVFDTGAGELGEPDRVGPDGRLYQAWDLRVTAGLEFTVDLVSTDFDALLYVLGPGIATLLEDDDGASNCNSRMTLVPQEDGPYRIVASSFDGRSGPYRIFVTDEPGTARPGACGPGIR